MTIREAENQYKSEIENLRKQHTVRIKKSRLIWSIISIILIVSGIILAIIGFNTPPEEIYSSGYESLPIGAIFERLYGIGAICLGAFILLLLNLFYYRALKNGPQNFLPQIKELYYNYLKCTDMSDDYKQFYKQKLEDIRNAELVNAIHRASAAATAAIMFNSLK